MAKHIHIHMHSRTRDGDTYSEYEKWADVRGKDKHSLVTITAFVRATGANPNVESRLRDRYLKTGDAWKPFTTYDPREATRLDDEIKDIQQQITSMKSKNTVPAYQLQDLERTLEKLRKERAKYHTNLGDSKARDSKLEDLERQLDELETQIEKLEDTGQSPTRALLDKRKQIQGAIAVIKSARKTGDEDQTGLWRYNSTTGYWVLERMCSTVSSGKWLEVFKKDEPSASFKLSKTKPSGKPTGDGEAPFRRPGHTLEDIAIGGTVIYKEGQKWALSKARQKREPGNLVLENGKTISILDVWSTDRSDWAKFEAANKTD